MNPTYTEVSGRGRDREQCNNHGNDRFPNRHHFLFLFVTFCARGGGGGGGRPVNWIYDPIFKAFASQSAGLSDIPAVNENFLHLRQRIAQSVQLAMEHTGQDTGKLCFRPPARDTFLYLDAMSSGGYNIIPSWCLVEYLGVFIYYRSSTDGSRSEEASFFLGALCFRSPARDKNLYLDATPSGGMTFFLSWSLYLLSLVNGSRDPSRIGRSVYFSMEHGGMSRENCAFGFRSGHISLSPRDAVWGA
jgi:hypothetical protein